MIHPIVFFDLADTIITVRDLNREPGPPTVGTTRHHDACDHLTNPCEL